MRIRYSEENGKLVRRAVVHTREEHGINNADVDPDAARITRRLKSEGYETYVVGGAVRDLMLGKKPKDFDIVTEATPSRLRKIFRSARIIGNRFRLVHVCFGSKIFEVSTFRSMRDGPTSNTFGTIEEDVMRRDFTLNALFYDPQKQIVVDYVGGVEDIRRKRIRPIIPLSAIFTDDPVRMLRAVKYAAATGFAIPFSLGMKIRQQAGLLSEVSPSRLTEEMLKILRSSCAGKIVAALDSYGLYRCLQPEAAGLFRKNPAFRQRYLQTMAALNQDDSPSRPGEAAAALVRDFLEEKVDWAGGASGQPEVEMFNSAFFAAREFVLPINPPRMELYRALRLIFAGHGITVRSLRPGERPGRPRRGGEDGGEGAGGQSEGAPRRRRRRRRPGGMAPAPRPEA
ncbi:MAG: polyA polymerase family protein [Treponematales bacterium]